MCGVALSAKHAGRRRLAHRIARDTLAKSVRRSRVEPRPRRRFGIRDAVSFEEEELEHVELLASNDDRIVGLLDRLPQDRGRVIDGVAVVPGGAATVMLPPDPTSGVSSRMSDSPAARRGEAARESPRFT